MNMINGNKNPTESMEAAIGRIFNLCFEGDTGEEIDFLMRVLGPKSLLDMLQTIEMHVKSLQLGNESASVKEFRRIVREKEMSKRANEKLKKKIQNLEAEVERLNFQLSQK